jgi:two-component system sensor histidine kinase PilS (NtrC family)
MARRLPLFVREIRDSQERLIRSERLASIGECAGALAHEIRNPLGSLVAAAKMLSARTPQAASYDREELVQIIGDEARRLNRILTDFLTFAKPRPPSLSAQSLNALAQDVVESLRLDELAAGKRLEARLDPELPPCSVDRDQVKQVLWNVLRNALEASPASGCVTISTEAGAGHAAVEIADEGPGIPSDRQGRLFEPFYTTKRGGSGLGLAIAHRIVTAHGGSIEIASGSGDGTRVRIRLPLAAGRGCGEGEAA